MSPPLLLMAHGAGLGSASPWMTRWAGYLAQLGVVVPFDYPYMRAGKKRPDRHPVLLQAHAEALAGAVETHRDQPVVLIGKSMGSRIGCHLANDPGVGDAVGAVVCLGYPLVGFGKVRRVRDDVLIALRQPILFVQGTRDRLCPLDLLEEVRSRMTATNALFSVEGGDHSLQLRVKDRKDRGITQEEADRAAVSAIGRFLAHHVR